MSFTTTPQPQPFGGSDLMRYHRMLGRSASVSLGYIAAAAAFAGGDPSWVPSGPAIKQFSKGFAAACETLDTYTRGGHSLPRYHQN